MLKAEKRRSNDVRTKENPASQAKDAHTNFPTEKPRHDSIQSTEKQKASSGIL
jgi:hypothetical protein